MFQRSKLEYYRQLICENSQDQMDQQIKIQIDDDAIATKEQSGEGESIVDSGKDVEMTPTKRVD